MNEFQAAMGICNLRHLEAEIAKRQAVLERYRSNLGGIDGVTICEIQPDVKSNYAYFPVMFDEKVFGFSRNEVMAKLQKTESAQEVSLPADECFSCLQRKV